MSIIYNGERNIEIFQPHKGVSKSEIVFRKQRCHQIIQQSQ